MPLNIKVPCFGQEHILSVYAVEDEDEEITLVAEITYEGHDREYDEACNEFNYPMPECYGYSDLINGKTVEDVLTNSELFKMFLNAMSEQGVEALGFSKNDFAAIIINCIEEEPHWGWGEWDTVLNNINTKLKWFKDLPIFKAAAPSLAKKAYDNEDEGFFRIVNRMFVSDRTRGIGLMRVESEEDEEKSYSGLGSASTGATVKIFIDDKLVDEWSFEFHGWFADIESMAWHVERADSSGSASYTTELFLNADGLGYGSEDVEKPYKPEEPWLPPRSNDGDWRILHDAYEWGHFKTEDDALDVYNSMRDAAMSGRGRFGIELTLLHKTKTPDGRYEIRKDDPFDDDDDGRDKDGYFWEIIGSDEI